MEKNNINVSDWQFHSCGMTCCAAPHLNVEEHTRLRDLKEQLKNRKNMYIKWESDFECLYETAY